MSNILTLNRDIYDINSVKNAIRAYANFADIECSETNDQWICIFTNCRYDASLTMMEFENYLIGILNRRLSNAAL